MVTSKTAENLATINKTINQAREAGAIHLSTEDEYFNGREIQVDGKNLINFSSCSYLGLELDPRMKAAAIDAIQRYGTQFSSSRAYVSLGLYDELESLLSQIYQSPVLVAPTTTLGHMSLIPTIIGDDDVVILDHQVHASVALAVQTVKARSVKVEMIRHNSIEMLEQRIQKLRKEYNKIWYFADGVYSMYGDYAPMDELISLLNKYDQFHLYMDDAHGTGWTGKNGSGYVRSKIGAHPRVFITGSMAKGFGAVGGILVLPNEETRQLVRNCGGTMIFSGPIQPASLAAAVQSAKIQLSPEIHALQYKLAARIERFNQMAEKLNIELISESDTPICFVHVGMPEVGFNMVRRLKEQGYFVNIAVYPSVPYKNTGLRLTIHNHLRLEDIDNVLRLIAENLPLAIQEENQKKVLPLHPVAA
ncbi:MAG: aminotransferase class I/II-fold pyridoxal phosphate-dependent enzyme [Bacteroidia bacterium]|nr:aminotransferase class I/II-fold pyridoxal phosphate-dependent enzyme [Bacteroidia bacterium]